MSFEKWVEENKGHSLDEYGGGSIRTQAMNLGDYGQDVGVVGFGGLMQVVEALKQLAAQDQQAYFAILNKIKTELAQLGGTSGDQTTQDMAKDLRTAGVRFAQGAKKAGGASPTSKPQALPGNGMPTA